MSFLKPISIRKTLAEIIKNSSIPGVLDNVFVGRSQNGWPEEGPFIVVYTEDTDFDKSSYSDETYEVTCNLKVEIHALGSVYQREGTSVVEIGVDDQLDILANYVAASIFRAGIDYKRNIPCGFDNVVQLVRTTKNVSGEGEKDSGCLVMMMKVVYNDDVLYEEEPFALESIKNTLNVNGGDSSRNIEWIIGVENA